MPDRIDFAPFALDTVNQCLWRGPRAIKLRPKAFAVVQQLVKLEIATFGQRWRRSA